MTYYTENLAALIGSRICHDLISPIGAVNNGLELLSLSGAPEGPEMALVSNSAASANARIRLFRLAFGIASDTQITRGDEIRDIWRGVHHDGRITLDWAGPDSMERTMARLIVLACLCCEVALPLGGSIHVMQDGNECTLTAKGPKLAIDPGLWDGLLDLGDQRDIQPAHVQFVLLPHHLGLMGRKCSYRATEEALTIAL